MALNTYISHETQLRDRFPFKNEPKNLDLTYDLEVDLELHKHQWGLISGDYISIAASNVGYRFYIMPGGSTPNIQALK